MAELLKEEAINTEQQRHEPVYDSDDSLDSDGYDKNDPYAATAKRIDKNNKVVQEFHERPLQKVSKSIIENKEKMTYFEKTTMKYVVLIGLLIMLVYTNLKNAPDTSKTGRSADGSKEAITEQGMFGMSSISGVLSDMSRELIMLGIAVGGYVIMANINNYLDRLDAEELERQK